MFRVTRRYGFAASHRLHSPELSDAENDRVYGKCNNPYGHGHNYVILVSVRGPLEPAAGRVLDPARLDALVTRHVLEPLEHQDLNTGIDWFQRLVPTTENLGTEICRRLKQSWPTAFLGEWPQLEKVRIEETPRNIFEISADEIE